MKTIYGVVAFTSYPGCQNIETRISYWAEKEDAEKICKCVLRVFKELGRSGMNAIVVELNVTEVSVDGVTKFEKEDPRTKCKTYPEIRQKIEQSDFTNAKDNVNGFLGAIAHLKKA